MTTAHGLARPGPTRPGWRLRGRAEHGLLLLPYVLGTLALTVLPALLTVALAFTSFNGMTPPR